VLVPLVLVIVFFALYPQLALHRSEGSVKTTVASVHTALAKARESEASTTAQTQGEVSGEARPEEASGEGSE
jgi:hypothetical protein